MAVLYNGPVSKGVHIDVAIGANYGGETALMWKASGVQENNIRLWGMTFIYTRNLLSETDQYTSLPGIEMRQRRGQYRFPDGVSGTTIWRLVPLYDFAQVVLEIRNTGLS